MLAIQQSMTSSDIVLLSLPKSMVSGSITAGTFARRPAQLEEHSCTAVMLMPRRRDNKGACSATACEHHQSAQIPDWCNHGVSSSDHSLVSFTAVQDVT